MSQERAGAALSLPARFGLAAGSFTIAVSTSLFVYTISPLSSVIVSALFIAGGVVGRRRVPPGAGQAIAAATIAGGVVAAIAAIALAAAGR